MLLLALAGCLGTRSAEQPPDERFGHRPAGAADGRPIVTTTPADSAVAYFFYPAPFDTVVVRPAPLTAGVQGQQVEVEVLVKGAFPDACSELHEVEQVRTGHLITATLRMRKPQGRICASVRRPYRFYVLLDGRYGVGSYTLKLNGTAVPFVIHPPRDGSER